MTVSDNESQHLPLGEGREFDLIRKVWKRLGRKALPSGDDCAIINVGGVTLAVSTDMFVQDTHFRTGWLTSFELGWRAATGALSDLAAMAATPRGLLASLAVPDDTPDDHVVDLMQGVADAAAEVGARVWGGDLVQATKITVDITVIGTIEGHPVKRAGAQVGDTVVVTGRLGGPAEALAAWEAGTEPESVARARFAKPVARVAEAHVLRDLGATSMIDLSDGLVNDAVQLALASDVSLEIDLDRLPAFADCSVEQAVQSGEEYELLATLPPGALDALPNLDCPVTPIGVVRAGDGVRYMRDGQLVSFPQGFRHFGDR